MKLSIIIPVFNEAAVLPTLFDQLQRLHRQGVEILVADGGSHDGSAVIAEVYGYRVIHSVKGRATQMNTAAAQATGNVLLFLHADTQLPDDALPQIQAALASKKYVWGRFNVRIVGRAWMLNVVSFAVNCRSWLSGIATGDQGIFVTRTAFNKIGGFPEQPLMEDVEISNRLRRHSPPACLNATVATSGRRWEKYGVWTTIFLMWRLRWAYWRGVSPEILIKEYQ